MRNPLLEEAGQIYLRRREYLLLHLAYLVARESLTGHAGHVPALCRGAWRGLHRRLGSTPTLDSIID